MRSLVFAALTLVVSGMAAGQENPQPLTSEQAAKKVDQPVTVEMVVRSSGGGRNRYLNSTPNFAQKR